MIPRHWTLALILSLALTATAAVRAGETTSEPASSASVPSVTISAHSEKFSCVGLPRDEARRLAEDAQRAGAHAKAVECFRIAGEHLRADSAQLRVSADTGAASAQKIKANVELAKAQAKRIRQAWRR